MAPSVCDESGECFQARAVSGFSHPIKEGWCPVENENGGGGPLIQTAGMKVFLFLILCLLLWWLLFAFNVTLLRTGILVSECRLLGALGHTSCSQYREGHMGICPENSNLHIICLQWWGGASPPPSCRPRTAAGATSYPPQHPDEAAHGGPRVTQPSC